MKYTRVAGLAIAALMISSLVTVGLSAEEKRIRRSELPAAVQKTADEQTRGATVEGYYREVEDGNVEYEVELLVNGHSRDVTIDSRGNVLEVEEEVSLEALPAAVRNKLKQLAGTRTIGKVETLTRKGSLVAYEAQIVNAGKRTEIQVTPDGQSLYHRE